MVLSTTAYPQVVADKVFVVNFIRFAVLLAVPQTGRGARVRCTDSLS
jgi:hypothetical protein